MVWTAMKFGPVTFQCTCHHGSHPFFLLLVLMAMARLPTTGLAVYSRRKWRAWRMGWCRGGALDARIAHDDEVRALRAGPVLHADRSESDQPLDMTADCNSKRHRPHLAYGAASLSACP